MTLVSLTYDSFAAFFARYSRRRRIKDKIYVALNFYVGIQVLVVRVFFFGELSTRNSQEIKKEQYLVTIQAVRS